MWNAGGDPWSRDVWNVERTIRGVDRGEELLPFVGPAAAMPLFGALARAPFDAAERAWSGMLAAACGALVLAVLALRRERRVTVLLGAMLFVLASGAGTSALSLAQSAMLSAAGIAWALVAFERRNAFAAGALVLLSAIQPNLALAAAARLRDRAAWLAAAGALVAFGVLTLWCGGGVAGFTAYLADLRAHGAAERFIAIQYAPVAIAHALGASDAAAGVAGAVVALVTLAAVVATILRAQLDALDGALLALAALPLMLPFFHEHDFVVTLIPLLAVTLRASGATRALAGVATALIGVDWFGLAQRTNAAAHIVTLGVGIACAFAAVGPGRRATRADLAPLLAFVAIACVALPLALAHRAPTWPDALPDGYRAPSRASASAVWGDEQRAAGLDAAVPAWGALRAIPLAGCVVLGVAIAAARRRREREAFSG